MMESIYDLFFELSNETRLGLMRQLSLEPQRLTVLSNKLDLPAQEISRQLSRLDKISITSKDVDGLYHLTPYGRHLLSLLPGYMFLTENREYFKQHTMTDVPDKFQQRIGDLEGSTFVDDVMMSFHFVEEVIRKSEEFIWIMSDQVLISTIPLLKERIDKGVYFRLILPSDMVVAKPLQEYFMSGGMRIPPSEKARTRYADNMGIVIIVSEKELALAAFKSLEGDFDYKGFRSKTEKCAQWGREVFEYIWERSTDKIPEQILDASRN